ncbi:predicted protein [Uncinocarpus reesii 1704]|uniref:Uncharacterized protein n=1 Tax=Uncinocarpus reesii (strain UAMH 1704) TaxID=336963 RepID=C4JPU3_UNCRE|nr:uncharacterized protein UREG_04586 [Uncinocarpus reesii 1704]EEP79740.1 predicted protein [Uncinocarpus reesii 1704]
MLQNTLFLYFSLTQFQRAQIAALADIVRHCALQATQSGETVSNLNNNYSPFIISASTSSTTSDTNSNNNNDDDDDESITNKSGVSSFCKKSHAVSEYSDSGAVISDNIQSQTVAAVVVIVLVQHETCDFASEQHRLCEFSPDTEGILKDFMEQ